MEKGRTGLELIGMNDHKSNCLMMLRFHQWRQGKIAALLTQMNADLLTEKLNGSFSSLNVILYHIVWAEKLWLGRVNHNEMAAMKDLDTAGLLSEWLLTADKWKKLLEETPSDNYDSETHVYFNSEGVKFENTLFEIFTHLTDHSSHHIGQMMSAIRALGQAPAQTNYIHFLRDNKQN
jgi:uncharacterized damage-inducible protein DinB